MRFRRQTTEVPGHYTRDGITVPVTRPVTVKVPVFPKNWNLIALKATVTIVIGLTVLVVLWSTWSIGSLLGGGIGYAVAVIFDVGWAVALLLEYLSRYDESKRRFPQRLGWLLLVATMGAIFWHGITLRSVPMAVVGAAVSFFAKILWHGVMKHVNVTLAGDHKAWVAKVTADAQAEAAIAQIRRQTARTTQLAALELLAMEREKAAIAEAYGLPVAGSQEDVAAATEVVQVDLETPTLADMRKADAIRFVADRHPELSAAEITDVLDDHGVSTNVAYVRQAISRMAGDDTQETNVVSIAK